MKTSVIDTKYEVHTTTLFKSQLKKINKQHKDINKLLEIITILANGKNLNLEYKDHSLNNNKLYKNCRECHIEPDWLLIYKIQKNKLILLLFATGSHSELFK